MKKLNNSVIIFIVLSLFLVFVAILSYSNRILINKIVDLEHQDKESKIQTRETGLRGVVLSSQSYTFSASPPHPGKLKKKEAVSK